MLTEGFTEFLCKVWSETYHGDSLEKCQERLRNLRKKVRGWDKNANAWYRKIKIEIIGKLDVIDKNTDVMGLTIGDR